MSLAQPWFVRAVTRLADGLTKLRRRLLPPHLAALEMGTASWVAQSLAAFCELRLPEALAEAPSSAKELATRGYGDEAMLFRLLRDLAAYEIVRYHDGRFSLAYVGRGLAGDSSMAPAILYANAPWHSQAYSSLAGAVRSSRSGMELSHGKSLFDFLAQSEEAGATFDAAMQSLARMQAEPFAAACDCSRLRHIVDIGGGTGALMAALLRRYPNLRGTLFELPAVAARAREFARTSDFESRLAIAEGSVLSELPPPGDAYVLSHVLHDWDDESCVRMLSNVRRAMNEGSKLFIFEIVARPPDSRWSQDRLTDLEMLAMLPGRERTREEFERLLSRAGLRLVRIIPTPVAESILECVAEIVIPQS